MDDRDFVFTGEELAKIIPAYPAEREGVSRIREWIAGDDLSVMLLIGLRRTGKTTMMLQSAGSMPGEELERTAYIVAREDISFAELKDIVNRLKDEGIRKGSVTPSGQ